jgi:hypothetical protein
MPVHVAARLESQFLESEDARLAGGGGGGMQVRRGAGAPGRRRSLPAAWRARAAGRGLGARGCSAGRRPGPC